MDVAGALAKIGGHAALDLCDVDDETLVIDLVDHPGGAGDGDLAARGRRRDERAKIC